MAAGHSARELYENIAMVPLPRRETIFVELVTSDRKLKASREGSK